MMKKLLIIEDTPEETQYARDVALRAGYVDITVVSTLSDALETMHNYDIVLSDMFFPAGSMPTEQYSTRFMPYYEADLESRRRYGEFQPIVQEGDVRMQALERNSRMLGITPLEFIERYMVSVIGEEDSQFAYDVVAGMTDSKKYAQIQQAHDGIRLGVNLPLGIIAMEHAQELGKPVVIVSSLNHHNYAFEPIRSLLTVPYRHGLVQGKKDWQGGLEELLRLS